MPLDLTTDAGRAELDGAVQALRAIAEHDPVRLAGQARARFGPELAQASMAQLELRARAVDKFGQDAAAMFLSRAGLEQSSRRQVADHRAGRFAAAGRRAVLDLCAGIGGDALAFVRAGLRVTAVEADLATAQLLTANLAGAGAVVVTGDARESDWKTAQSVFIDPARRTSTKRVFDPAACSPPFDFVVALLAGAGFAAAKLGPGLAHELIPEGVEAEWVSYRSGVKEAVLWSPAFAESGVTRRASVLTDGGATQLTDTAPAQDEIGAIGAYLYEPDGAVIRAGLVQQAAALLPGGRRIDEHLAYLSGDGWLQSPLVTGFRVLDVLPYSASRLRAELRRRGVGVVEIKKRGVDVDPAVLRRQLKPAGPLSLTVLLARVGQRRLAILAERVEVRHASRSDPAPRDGSESRTP